MGGTDKSIRVNPSSLSLPLGAPHASVVGHDERVGLTQGRDIPDTSLVTFCGANSRGTLWASNSRSTLTTVDPHPHTRVKFVIAAAGAWPCPVRSCGLRGAHLANEKEMAGTVFSPANEKEI